jgi:hypothetical protein
MNYRDLPSIWAFLEKKVLGTRRDRLARGPGALPMPSWAGDGSGILSYPWPLSLLLVEESGLILRRGLLGWLPSSTGFHRFLLVSTDFYLLF